MSQAFTQSDLKVMATALRILSIDQVETAKSGHLGLPLGFADVFTVLFSKHLCFDPKNSTWPNRDRFVLAAGHGSAALYALLYLTGQGGLTLEDLKKFRSVGSRTPGHPEFGLTPGVETTTGPLGQGIGNAVGMAIAQAHFDAKFGHYNHKVYCVAGDGDLMEGISYEACSLAAHLKLKNLILLWDDNHITIDGSTELSTSENTRARFEAMGWVTRAMDGHNLEDIDAALTWAKAQNLPVFLQCTTEIGHGSPNLAGSNKIHGTPLGPEEEQLTRQALNWPYPSFEIPENILSLWRACGLKGISEQWGKEAPTDLITALNTPLGLNLAAAFQEAAQALIGKDLPGRTASQKVLEILVPISSGLLGGSADLSESNLTHVSSHTLLTASNPAGNYLSYGTREHAMGAVMNGLALSGGIRPYGGTFLTFSDYLRPALRLSALSHLPVVYVFTHDSIFLGEDGPTHQPIEHLNSLRMIPGLHVWRPADGLEVVVSWNEALAYSGPTALALSRQTLTALPGGLERLDKIRKGGYVVRPGSCGTILATGSEVALALAATEGMDIQVSSLPCLAQFLKQDPSYQEDVLGKGPRLALEAGSPDIWYRFTPHVFSLERFGLSGKGPDVYRALGFSKENVRQKMEELL